MNFIKRFVAISCAMFMFLSCSVFTALASTDDNEKKPIYAKDLNDGSYNIEVTSSSSMFRIINCELNVSQGEMTAVITLSGTGYEKLFMGVGEEALASSDENCIYFVENEEGKYTYTVPVEALDKDIECAAWSIRKQQWYDRIIVFESDTLPEGALIIKTDISSESANISQFNPPIVVIAVAALILVVMIVVLTIIIVRKKK